MRHYGTHQIQTASYLARRHNSRSGNVDDVVARHETYVMFTDPGTGIFQNPREIERRTLHFLFVCGKKTLF
jgi:hypothetical protein